MKLILLIILLICTSCSTYPRIKFDGDRLTIKFNEEYPDIQVFTKIFDFLNNEEIKIYFHENSLKDYNLNKKDCKDYFIKEFSEMELTGKTNDYSEQEEIRYENYQYTNKTTYLKHYNTSCIFLDTSGDSGYKRFKEYNNIEKRNKSDFYLHKNGNSSMKEREYKELKREHSTVIREPRNTGYEIQKFKKEIEQKGYINNDPAFSCFQNDASVINFLMVTNEFRLNYLIEIILKERFGKLITNEYSEVMYRVNNGNDWYKKDNTIKFFHKKYVVKAEERRCIRKYNDKDIVVVSFKNMEK